MYNKERFKAAVEGSGLKRKFICEQIGMAYDTFLKKQEGVVTWKIDEAQQVSEVLQLSRSDRDAIFFARGVANSKQ